MLDLTTDSDSILKNKDNSAVYVLTYEVVTLSVFGFFFFFGFEVMNGGRWGFACGA